MKDTPLNSLGFLWIGFAGIVADGLFVWPLHIVVAAGQNADIVLGIIACWGLGLALLTPPRPAQTAPWTLIIWGLNLCAVLGVVVLDAVVLSELSGMLQTFFYFDTPKWALTTPLLAVVARAAMRRGNLPWRVTGLWIPPVVFGGAAVLAVAFTTVHHLRPLEPNSFIAVGSIVNGLGVVAFLGLPAGVTLRLGGSILAKPPRWT